VQTDRPLTPWAPTNPPAHRPGDELSIRVYQGPHARTRGRGGRWLRRSPWLFLLLSTAAEVAWTSSVGKTQDRLLLAACGFAFLAAVAHAMFERSAWWATGFVIAAYVVWFLADLANRYSDLPFGHVRFTDRFSLWLVGVPVAPLLGWVAITYAALIAARRVAKATLLVAVFGATYLAAADIVVQSALEHFGYLHWINPSPTVPGIPGIPAQDFVGCLLVGVLVLLLIDLLPTNPARDSIPRLIFGWRYLGDIVGAAAVLDQPVLAVFSAVIGGALAVPYGYLLFVDRV
jgi:hypothetical protein